MRSVQRVVERPHVAVVGSGAAGEEELELATRVGSALAEGGAVVVCGGLGGVMAAAAAGAGRSGGTSIGIVPGPDRRQANQFVDVALATGMGEGRNMLVVRNADALVAVGGEFGTLSEVALALQAGIPVVGLGTWELSKGGRPVEAVLVAATPEEAAAMALREAGRRSDRG